MPLWQPSDHLIPSPAPIGGPLDGAGVGAEVDVLEQEIAYFDTDDSDQDESTNTRLWVYGNYDFTDKISLEAKFERVESDLWDHYNRGRLRLNLLF